MENTAVYIDISWNFDDILANQQANMLAKLAFQQLSKNKSLPFIDNIKLDISGNTTYNSGTNAYKWLNLHTFSIGNNDDYNTDAFKTYRFNKTSPDTNITNDILNILSKTDKFAVRVYGTNFAVDYPSIENRALIFNNIHFQIPRPPNSPIFVSENTINSDELLGFVYKVTETEFGRPNSIAEITNAIIDYSQNETLVSSIYNLNTNTQSVSKTITPNKNANENFNLSLTGLRAGTIYNYRVKTRNNIETSYSELGEGKISDRLNIPGNSSYSNIIANLSSSTNKTVTTPINTANLNSENVIYIQTESGSGAYTGSYNVYSSIQNIQITNPSANKFQTKGYGKWIDNSQNLIQLDCRVNNSLKQTITFNGFNTTNNNNGSALRTNSNSNTFSYFNLPTQSDIYTSNIKKGYRLFGSFSLNDIASNEISAIGAAQSTKHVINYKYTRHADVNNTANNDISHNIYIDTLANDPISVDPSNTPIVTSVIYTMGIPSVKTFDISMNRTYKHINSEFQYLPGNLIIANIQNIESTNKTTSNNIVLDRALINTSGEYLFLFTDIYTQTGNHYKNIYYNTEINNENGTSLNINENVISLRKTNSQNSTVTVEHFFDKDSYNSVGSSLISNKLIASIYEISDANELAKLNSDVGDIGITQYNNHETKIQDWTILYLGGKFRTNANKTYPNINNYQYNGVNSIVHGSGQYSSGTKAYELNGTTESVSGYKWIAFSLNKNNNGYSMMGVQMNILTNGDGNKYINLYSALSNFFNQTTIGDLFDDSNTNAIGFCRATKIGTTNTIIGSFKQPWGPTGQNWTVNGTGVKSYTDISTSMSYGSIVEDSSTNKGIYINKTAINDDLKIFIGLKNNWNEI